ncbi:MAG: PfkB family carbohydrate kinase [Methanobacteriota archaeon]
MYEKKILSLGALAKVLERERKKGKNVVQCHGCFDLLHPGHVKHFEAAKKFGDILVVTVTPDRFVNKGPGRPVYNERLRAETIASLVFVDYVALNEWPDAANTIKLVKPRFYVKGQDYKDRKDDVTGKIYEEEAAVKSVGGEMRFTEEVTFSSTGLINQFYSVLSDEANQYLRSFRPLHGAGEISRQLEGLAKLEVLVVGDAIIDDYTFCKAMGMVIKAPIVSARELKTERYAGGALAVANHVSNFVKKVHLVTSLGWETDVRQFVSTGLGKNVELHVIERPEAPSIVKRRFIEQFNNQKMLEVTKLDDSPLSTAQESEAMSHVRRLAKKCSLTLAADFGHGFMTPSIVEQVCELGGFVAANAQTNSANYGYNPVTKYVGADYLCMDERELRLPLSDKFGPVEECVARMSDLTKCDRINVTLGKSGSLYYHDGDFHFVPVFSSDIVDSVGAGDAVFAITSLLASRNAPPEVIPFVGNCVGAMKIRILGNKESIRKPALLKFVGGLLK